MDENQMTMEYKEELNTIYKRVKELLFDNWNLRDNDKEVVWQYWIQFDQSNSEAITRYEFCYKLTEPESITRACRKVREDYPEYGGTTDAARIRLEREKANVDYWKKKIKQGINERRDDD